MPAFSVFFVNIDRDRVRRGSLRAGHSCFIAIYTKPRIGRNNNSNGSFIPAKKTEIWKYHYHHYFLIVSAAYAGDLWCDGKKVVSPQPVIYHCYRKAFRISNRVYSPQKFICSFFVFFMFQFHLEHLFKLHICRANIFCQNPAIKHLWSHRNRNYLLLFIVFPAPFAPVARCPCFRSRAGCLASPPSPPA